MLFVSEYDIIVEPYRSIIIILTLILVIGAFLIGVYTMLSSRKSEAKLSKSYFLGIGMFSILFGVGRLIYLIHDYFAPDALDIILWKIATTIVFSGLIFLIFTIETYVYKKTKRVFTVTGLIILVAVIIFERDIARIFIYIGNPLLLLIPFLIYIIILRNSTGAVRKNTIFIIIGMLFFALGQGTALFELVGIMTKEIASIFAPPVSLIGLAILGYGFTSMSL